MAKKIGTRTVTVVRQPRVDRLDPNPPPAAIEHDIEGCAIVPRASQEEGKGWVVVEGYSVFAPHGADVTADDRVRFDGVLWDVDGEPGDYENKRGRGKATIFYLTRGGG